MRAARLLVVLAGLVGAGSVLVPSCREATQVTLEISLRNAECSEIHGAAVTVGVNAAETEKRVAGEFVSGSTSACAPATETAPKVHAIGTLVVTPSDPGRASIIVVVAYDKTNPASCKPPDYKGCIVARRQFSFTAHSQLRMPISIDPNCKDVPCTAFSTCRSGLCFDANVSCDDGTCTEPGAAPDGGTTEAGAMLPDTGADGPIGPLSDGGKDAASDADAEAGGEAGLDPLPFCMGGSQPMLHCHDDATSGDVACMGPSICCDAAAGPARCVGGNQASCTGQRYCCRDTDCAIIGEKCAFAGAVGRCVPSTPPAGTFCLNDVLHCPMGGNDVTCAPGSVESCCGPAGGASQCLAGPLCPPKAVRYCCVQSDCNGQGTCPGVIGVGMMRNAEVCSAL